MPYKPRERSCANCGQPFPYTPRCASEQTGGRIYCGRRCTLQFQRAHRSGRLTPEQKANAEKAEYKPALPSHTMPAIRSPEGARLRREYLERNRNE